MIDVQKMLCNICESEEVFDDNIDLIDSGLLDSYAVIELLSQLQDEGIEIQITQINRELLRSIEGIEKIIKMNS